MSDISYSLTSSLLFNLVSFLFQFTSNKLSFYYFRLNMSKDKFLFYFKLPAVSDFFSVL